MDTVITSTFSAVWTTDDQGVCITSQEYPEGLIPALKGVTLSAWLKFAQADDDAKIAQQLTAALEGVAPFHIEVPIRCLDGKMRRVIFSGLPHCQPSPDYSHYQGFILDITGQRKALEDALRTAAEYRLLIENSTDLIAHCDASGRYVSVSPSYSAMMGWSADEMNGQRVIDFLHPDDRGPATEALEHIFSGGILPDVVEVRKRHRDGYYLTLGTKACGVSNPSTGRNIGAVLVSRDITRDKERMERLEKMATRDMLTGLPNRAWINTRIEQMLAQPKDADYTTVLFLDLNGFKAVNDTMGHAAGDTLLQQVSKRLKQCMRPGDAVARLGGDEFVIAARCTNRKAASSIAQRIIESLAEPFTINKMEVRVGAAIGISLAQFGTASAKTLLDNADVAMYQAKARRDGSYQFFDAAPQITNVQKSD
ncbi:diguanylate cyclase [Pantoea dispersa]|uniref:sensor domain-containing diguanylate cyclase n=1 Tax=Pantoea TaxID=53335 RepID=UPI0010A8F40B|nr:MULTISPECIES: sensor domain-containing diguanylate cyclase [Pantoea]MBK4772204.1 diguanylate cyclase [Pantoea sp. Morm]THD41213.1 sensor domain-containing diguanylate cyclase [Pantoea sp. R102]UKY38550.1 diguanylate cyclase [Pantoea dispersa]WEA07741.1 diguanylate cyclase [Pantoea dispersa]